MFVSIELSYPGLAVHMLYWSLLFGCAALLGKHIVFPNNLAGPPYVTAP